MKKTQEDMKRQADKERKKTENWKKRDKVLLSTKDLVFKEKPARKLVDRYVGPYTIEEVVVMNLFLRVRSKNNSLYQRNTRELNRVPSTK